MKSLREEIKKMLVSEFNIQWGNPESIDKILALFESAMMDSTGKPLKMRQVGHGHPMYRRGYKQGWNELRAILRKKLKEMLY